jgi:hypothetical protein
LPIKYGSLLRLGGLEKFALHEGEYGDADSRITQQMVVCVPLEHCR